MYISLISYSLKPLKIQIIYVGCMSIPVSKLRENRARDVPSSRYCLLYFYSFSFWTDLMTRKIEKVYKRDICAIQN
jgi:hypothetical protein